MKESFDALVRLGFSLRIDDFRCIVHEDAEIALGSTWERAVEDLSLRCGDVTTSNHVECFSMGN